MTTEDRQKLIDELEQLESVMGTNGGEEVVRERGKADLQVGQFVRRIDELRNKLYPEDVMAEAEDGAECPFCRCGTVEHTNGRVTCRGECGASVPLGEK